MRNIWSFLTISKTFMVYFFERNRSVRPSDALEKRIVSISTNFIFDELAIFSISREIARNPHFTSHIFLNFHGAIGENARVGTGERRMQGGFGHTSCDKRASYSDVLLL